MIPALKRALIARHKGIIKAYLTPHEGEYLGNGPADPTEGAENENMSGHADLLKYGFGPMA